MAVLARGRIVVWEGGSLWIFAADRPASRTACHSHHAIQLTLALEGGFELHGEGGVRAGPAVAVAADARHEFHAGGTTAMLFVDPDSAAGRALAGRWFGEGPLKPLDP